MPPLSSQWRKGVVALRREMVSEAFCVLCALVVKARLPTGAVGMALAYIEARQQQPNRYGHSDDE